MSLYHLSLLCLRILKEFLFFCATKNSKNFPSQGEGKGFKNTLRVVMSHNFVPESILTISFSSVQVKKQIYSNITCAHGNGGCAIGMTVIRFPLIILARRVQCFYTVLCTHNKPWLRMATNIRFTQTAVKYLLCERKVTNLIFMNVPM